MRTFLDSDGKEKYFIMGCYGIGVGRTLQAVIENSMMKRIIWPINLAPFKIEIIPLNTSDEEIVSVSERLYEELTLNNFDTLLDDRENLSAGEKFNDADLIGIPIQIIIGRAYKKEKKIEIKVRKTNERIQIEEKEVLTS